MSHAAVDWARADRTTTGNQRLLLLELAHYIDGNGEGWAARDRLLWGANMSLSSYRRALIALQRAGLVGVIVHGGGRGTGNDQYRPNAYYFLPMMSRDRIRTLGLEGVKTAPSEGVKTAPSYIKEDPYVDPYVDPPSSSELTNEPPVGTPQDDDDQASESEQDEHGAIIAAVCGQLAQHDLDQRPDHLDPIATPDRWLTSAAANRAQRHRAELGAAIACGVTAPAELVQSILVKEVSAQAVNGIPRAITVPWSESTNPAVVAERRRLQAVPDLDNDEPHLTREQSRERIRQAKETIKR